jgi:ribosomal protein S18 acetylase RimI-like enzyme
MAPEWIDRFPFAPITGHAVAAFDLLDNAIWSSLIVGHRPIARVNGRAARYAADVSPLAALEGPTAEAFADMAALLGPEEGVGFCTAYPIEAPPDWKLARVVPLEQMVCTARGHAPSSRPLELGQDDVPAMLALTAATEPGPFLPQTIQMGRYFGVKTETGRLVAMAGERLRPAGFTEISAVCTDPEFRGRGHARSLMSFLIAMIFAEGRTPFLHVKADNGAISLYRSLGFDVRCTMHLSIVTRA